MRLNGFVSILGESGGDVCGIFHRRSGLVGFSRSSFVTIPSSLPELDRRAGIILLEIFRTNDGPLTFGGTLYEHVALER